MTTEKMRALWATHGEMVFIRDMLEDALNRAEEPTFRQYIHGIYERLVLVADKGMVPREPYVGGYGPQAYLDNRVHDECCDLDEDCTCGVQG